MDTEKRQTEPIFSQAECDNFLQLVRDKKTSAEIADALQCSKSSVTIYMTWLKINGPDAFIDCFVHNNYREYSPYQIACIVETMIAYELNITQVCAIFRMRQHRLKKMLHERKEKGHPLLSAIACPLPEIQEHEFTGTYRRSNWKAVTDRAAHAYNPNQLDCQNRPLNFAGRPDLAYDDESLEAGVSYILPAERNTMPSDSREITGIERDKDGYNSKGEYVGKSTLLHEKSRGHRKRGHEPSEDKEQSEKSEFHSEEYQISQICSRVSVSDQESVQNAIDQITGIMHKRTERTADERQQQALESFTRAKEAGKRCLKEVIENFDGIPAKDFDPEKWGKSGRKPQINVQSEDFEELPLEVQNHALRSALIKITHELAVKNMKIEELEKKSPEGEELKLTNEELFNIADAFTDVTGMPISDVSKWVGLSRRQFYHYRNYKDNDFSPDHKHDRLKAAIRLLFEISGGRAGKSRITFNLPQYCKLAPGYDLVCRLMNEMKLSAKVSKSKTKINSYAGESDTATDNLTNRATKADSPGTLVAGDVCQVDVYINGHKVKLFISGFKDFGTEKITSYCIRYNTPLSLVSAHYRDMAEEHFQHEGLKVVHTDRGIHYMSENFARLNEEYNVTRSMSNKGNSLDNGKFEQVWAGLKRVAINGRTFTDMKDVINSIASYFEMVNSGFFRPIKSKYGTDYPRPVMRSCQTKENFEQEMAVWKRGNQVVHMITKGHGADNLRCPPSQNHLFKQVVHEIMDKNLDSDPEKAFKYARKRFDKLVSDHVMNIQKDKERTRIAKQSNKLNADM